jgi:hypothetical protein
VVALASRDLAALNMVGGAQIESIMRQALRCHTARLRNWEWQPLSYHAVLPDRMLARLSGWALLDGEPAAWSSVVKVIRQHVSEEPAEIATGTREILAYRSSLLVNLPGPLRAPRLLGIDEDDEGGVRLWLEDVRDIYARRWPLDQYSLAARHLGLFNGAYLVSRALPTEPWLNAWIRRHTAAIYADLERRPNSWDEQQQFIRHPLVQRLLGATIAFRTRQLFQDQPRFVQTLAQLPETLCHHESSLANLFAARRLDGQVETVAVDWEQVGPGPLGAEIATLVFGTLRRCEFDVERAPELDEAVFSGYVAGLREAGWEGDGELVRLGYTTAVALRWNVLASILRGLVEGAVPVTTSQGWRVSADRVVTQWVGLSGFLLDRADGARRLADSRSAR